MSTTRSYIKSDSTTPVTTLPIPPTVTEENAAILNIHMPSDIDNAYYPFPSDYTIHYPFNDNDESYEFVMDQSLLWITEDRLDSPRIIVTESHQRQMVSRTQDLGSYVLCYEIEGAHEGEDLASSLILQDLADYVVSEVRSTEVFGLFEDILLHQVYQKHESLSCVHIHADNPRSARPIWSN